MVVKISELCFYKKDVKDISFSNADEWQIVAGGTKDRKFGYPFESILCGVIEIRLELFYGYFFSAERVPIRRSYFFPSEFRELAKTFDKVVEELYIFALGIRNLMEILKGKGWFTTYFWGVLGYFYLLYRLKVSVFSLAHLNVQRQMSRLSHFGTEELFHLLL